MKESKKMHQSNTLKMKKTSMLSLFLACSLFSAFPAQAQAQNMPVILEVEEGVVGAGFNVEEEGGVAYITVDDSFFYGNGFGAKAPSSDADWIRANNLNSAGYAGEDQFVGGTSMSPIAEGKPKFLGSVYSQSQKVGFANYWNQVTPENAGKWGSVEPGRDNMNWTELDSAYALAKDNGFPYRHHVLIWGNQQPAWIENLPPAEQLEEIKEWFQAVAARYTDIDFVEVVNEALHDPPNSPGMGGGNYINALGGSGTTGWDWVLESFRLARQYFPNSQLLINDYNIVNSTPNTNQYLQIIGLLQAEGLIDQIGVQAHAFSTGASTTLMKANLDALAATGLPLYVTEMDIDGPTDQVQLNSYQRIFPLFWEHPAVKGITMWGFRPGMWRTAQRAYLIGEDGVTERPALLWLRGYVENTILSTHSLAPSADHITIFPNPISSQEIRVEGIDRLQRIELLDLSGRKLWAASPESNFIRIEAPLDSGLYILLLYDEQYVYAKKVVVGKE